MKGAWIFTALCFAACVNDSATFSTQKAKEEIRQTERSFCDDLKTKGAAYAFGKYADDDAVILRGNDSLIVGKEAIMHYYSDTTYTHVEADWSPDFVDVSADGTMGYTYGKYTWQSKNNDGKIVVSKGVFHTVWKRQTDGNWRYVWD